MKSPDRSLTFRPEHPPIEIVVLLPKRPRRRKLRSFGHSLEFCILMIRRPPRSTLFHYATLFRSQNILRLKKSCFYRNALGAESCDLSGTVSTFATQLPRHPVPHEISRSITHVSTRTSSD